MKILVGDTGFVGSNILKNTTFDKCFNSKNIADAYNTNPDLLVYSGVKAEKFVANKFPDEDLDHINQTIENISKINPRKIVLISTVDVYDKTENVDENYFSDLEKLQPYGKHRLILENWVRNNIEDHHIIRLSALFGINLKKNFIFDIINPIPKKITIEKMDILSSIDKSIIDFYYIDNGFYNLKDIKEYKEEDLLKILEKLNFTSLTFTDSRNTYQFYNLDKLSKDIINIISNEVRTINLVTEGLKASEIYYYLFNKEFKNEFLPTPVFYNIKTKYSSLFNGENGYIKNSNKVLEEIKFFIDNQI